MNLTTDTSSWLWAASLFSLVAAVGGLIVLRGLWLEGYICPESFKNIKEQRSHHKREAQGTKWVFWGVAFEVLIAFVMTFKEGCEAHKIATDLEKSSPLNQQIVDVAADVYFEANGKSEPDLPPHKIGTGGSGIATMWLCETNQLYTSFPLLYSDGFGRTFGVISDKARGYSLRFHENGMLALPFGSNRFLVKQISDTKFIYMSFSFLTNDAELVGGQVILLVNGGSGGVRRRFGIPPQKPFRSYPDQKTTDSWWVAATNFLSEVER